MTANFLLAPGTSGFIATPFAYGMVSGGNTTTQLTTPVDGSTPNTFTQTSGTTAQAVWGSVYFRSGGSFTPSTGAYIAGWFLRQAPNGGNTDSESTLATNQPPPRAPDFQIPLYAVAYASGSVSWAQGGYVKLPWETYQVFVQSVPGSGVSVPTSSTIRVGGVAVQY